jgi:hypothetical protein
MNTAARVYSRRERSRGDFDVVLPCPAGATTGDVLTIRLREPSAKDGTPTNRTDVEVAPAR